MRSHAKAPSAFTFGRKGFAAPALIALALAALFALSFSPSAYAAKKTALFMGSPTGASGSTAGLLSQPRDIAVNQAGTGGASAGDVYVVEGANNRISQFKADGTFVRAFGLDVVSTGPDQAREIQWVTVKATAGTFRLTFSGQNTGASGTGDLTESSTTISNVAGAASAKFTVGKRIAGTGIPAGTTITAVGAGTLTLSQPATATNVGVALSADLPFDASASTVQGALNNLSSIGGGGSSVSITGGPGNETGTNPYVVTFDGGPLAGTNVATMTSASGFEALSGGAGTGANTAAVLTARSGATGYEICNALANPTDVCKAGSSSGGLGGTLSFPGGVAINQNTGDLYVTDETNLRVQQYTATGQWARAWGGDVVLPGGVGESFAQVNERQTVTTSSAFGSVVGGTFKLTFDLQETAPIPYDASASSVQGALEGLSNIGPGDITVTGVAKGPWTIEFTGTLAETNVPDMTGNGSQLVGTGASPEAAVTVAQQGGLGGGPEVCSVSHQCKVGVSGQFGGGLGSLAVSGFGENPLTFSLAVVPSTAPEAGNILIPDPGNRRMQEFTAAGVFVRAFGFDVAKGGTMGYEICSVAPNCKGGTTGEALGQFGSGAPTRAAVDSTGRVYVIDGPAGGGGGISTNSNHRILTFDSARVNPSFFAQGHKFDGISPPRDIAIGPGNRVFILQNCPSGAGTISYDEYCPGGKTNLESRIREFDDQGVLVESHAVDFGFGGGPGLAANTANDRLYLSSVSSGPSGGGNRVWVLDDKGSQPAPIMTINPPTDLGEHTATFSGTVNPNSPGFNISYHFEVSKNGATWTPIAADVNLGSGTSPVNVPVSPAEGQATGLEANTFYRVRILSTRPFGAGSFASPELTFLTDGVKPETTTYNPQSHTDTTARLAGLLNANNMSTSYHFEYGETTAYGSSTPSASASDGLSNLVFAEAEGLKPATTYHYRLVATNAEGTSKGNDVTFTTYGAGVSAKPQRAYEMMTPPFKTVRSTTSFGGAVGNNPNPGVPSLDGNSMLWTTSIFPLTDDVKAPAGGDRRLLTRTAEGWTFETLNRVTAKQQIAGEFTSEVGLDFVKYFWRAVSGDQKTLTLVTDFALLPSEGYQGNGGYIYRDGTGVEGGLTPWITNTDTQGNATTGVTDQATLNDDGTALLRWGAYRGLAEDPATAGDDDPSDEQSNRSNVYLVRSDDPDGLPSAPKDLVNECTGSGAEATEIPSRVGSGSSATDTIGARSCEEASGAPAATGTAVRSTGSSTLTGLTTDSGAFAVGQVISGTGIPRGATVTALGAGTLTISSPIECGGAKGNWAKITAGSPTITQVLTTCGAFAPGQAISGPGIPGGATILAVDGYTLTISADATASSVGGGSVDSVITATAATTTALTANPQHVTSRSGARGGGDRDVSIGTLSNDGNRVFFMSPDFNSPPPASCASSAGLTEVRTECPPQLFVRQYDSDGNPTVRWISRAQGVGTQQIGLIGQGANFEGASRDGRHVFFKTNAPLLPTDPNAGSSITTGTAQANSWDLYRYTLPESLEEDPANGTLLRITGGPSGSADPNTNDVAGVSLRYFSDDGKRAYFVTRAEIPGAINSPPKGASTTPGGTVANNTTRNLYLFDETSGSPQWRFIARLPYSGGGTNFSNPDVALNACASSNASLADGHLSANRGPGRLPGFGNCFRGTPDGLGVVFFTRGQLTPDDHDEAGDVYLYDAAADELTRVSAAQKSGAAPYRCNVDESGEGKGLCNADLGIGLTGPDFAYLSTLDVNRGWGGGRQYNVGQDASGVIRVFFESESQLVSEDTNGDHMDVYEWSNGRLSLVSPGTGDSYSFYSGNSVDGRDVFLFTSARIDPREIDDDDYDLYDVRVGGGFPYTPPPTPCDVLAHQCRPNALPEVAPRSAQSSSLSGAGNVKSASKGDKCAKGKVRRKGRCVQKQSKAKKQKKRSNKRTGGANR